MSNNDKLSKKEMSSGEPERDVDEEELVWDDLILKKAYARAMAVTEADVAKRIADKLSNRNDDTDKNKTDTDKKNSGTSESYTKKSSQKKD